MKIYVSSTFLDLVEYRAAVADAVRRMGHEAKLMENYTAEDRRPLDKCVDDVSDVDCYVGIFAWRYGYVPQENRAKKAPKLPRGVVSGRTSITEAEYLAARARGIPTLIFLLDESAPWEPQFMDSHTGTNLRGRRIQKLRERLQRQLLTSFFSSPEELSSRVTSAVYRAEMRRRIAALSLESELDLHQLMMAGPRKQPPRLHDSTVYQITRATKEAEDERLLKVDLGSGRNWWSTRLFFMASMVIENTAVRSVVFVDGRGRLVGTATPEVVRDRLLRRHRELRDFEEQLEDPERYPGLGDFDRRSRIWLSVFPKRDEFRVKVWATKAALRSWLGEDLHLGGVDFPDEDAPTETAKRAMARKLREVLSDRRNYVPLEREGKLWKVVDRNRLAREIADNSLAEITG
jgi:hypothetical protein